MAVRQSVAACRHLPRTARFDVGAASRRCSSVFWYSAVGSEMDYLFERLSKRSRVCATRPYCSRCGATRRPAPSRCLREVRSPGRLPRTRHRGLRPDLRGRLVRLSTFFRAAQGGPCALLVTAPICPIDDHKRSCYGRAMGSASVVGRWRYTQPGHPYHGNELRDEVARGLPVIVKLVLETVELRPGDAELLADAVITDLDGTEARLGVATFTLDELAAEFAWRTGLRPGIETQVGADPSGRCRRPCKGANLARHDRLGFVADGDMGDGEGPAQARPSVADLLRMAPAAAAWAGSGPW